MRDVGADVDRIAQGEPLLDAKRVAAWVELHIEQGPVLVARELPIGIVTGIRGNVRHRTVECVGEAGHSGAVPRWLRHDAVFAVAELITHLDRHWRTLLERGRDLVDHLRRHRNRSGGTCDRAHSGQGVVQLRGAQPEQGDAGGASTTCSVRNAICIGEERGVEFKFDRRLQSAPATMDAGWVGGCGSAAQGLGLPDEEIPSGAGHDAAVFANAGIPSAMIFVRNENGSHNPKEAMNLDDFVAGVAVMRAAIEEAVQ